MTHVTALSNQHFSNVFTAFWCDWTYFVHTFTIFFIVSYWQFDILCELQACMYQCLFACRRLHLAQVQNHILKLGCYIESIFAISHFIASQTFLPAGLLMRCWLRWECKIIFLAKQVPWSDQGEDQTSSQQLPHFWVPSDNSSRRECWHMLPHCPTSISQMLSVLRFVTEHTSFTRLLSYS